MIDEQDIIILDAKLRGTKFGEKNFMPAVRLACCTIIIFSCFLHTRSRIIDEER